MYEFGEEEVEAFRRVAMERRLFRYPADREGECRAFEREFSDHLGCGHAVLLSSGTNALVAGLSALGVGEGDEVLVPAYTYVATAAAVRMVGARPIVVNIDDQLGLDPSEISFKAGPRAKAVIPVHMDGLCADLDGITRVAKAHKLAVLEDCAQAVGGSYRAKALGTWGDIGAFSLNESKNISCGEGGVVVTSDPALHHRAFCAHDLAARYNPTNQKTMPPFPMDILGQAGRVSEIQGAVMRVQLRRLGGILARLRERKQAILEEWRGMAGTGIIRGHDGEGECASSLHLKFSDPLHATAVMTALLHRGIRAAHPSGRPAHVAWKWAALTNPGEVEELNAVLRPSYVFLTCVLKLDVPYDKTVEEARAWGRMVREIAAGA